MDNIVLKSDRLILKILTPHDCHAEYVQWLNDEEINQYLEIRHTLHSLLAVQDFVEEQENNPNVFLFGIYEKDTMLHIGNIKLGPIHSKYKYADISYFIGKKSSQGRGLAKEAIALVCQFAFTSLKLRKLCAGCYGANEGSVKILKKSGFKEEGCLREMFPYKEHFTSLLIFGLLYEDYEKFTTE